MVLVSLSKVRKNGVKVSRVYDLHYRSKFHLFYSLCRLVKEETSVSAYKYFTQKICLGYKLFFKSSKKYKIGKELLVAFFGGVLAGTLRVAEKNEMINF